MTSHRTSSHQASGLKANEDLHLAATAAPNERAPARGPAGLDHTIAGQDNTHSGLPWATVTGFRDLLWSDWVMMTLIFGVMVSLTVVRSRTHLLWADELFTRSMITPPSIRTMLLGSYKGADGGGVLFYLLARGWAAVFGTTALALRLFSTIGMCVALVFTWAGVRRYLPALPVALAVGLVYLTTPVLLWQYDNARFYGLFLAFACIAGYLFLKASQQGLSRWQLVALGVAHAGLIASHILGIAYSCALIVGMVVVDRLSGRFRPSLYAAALSGWLVFLVTLPAIRASAKVGANHFWTVRPNLALLLTGTTLEGRFPSWALLIALLLTGASLLLKSSSAATLANHKLTAPFVLCLALLGVQISLFLKSQVGTSIYVDRYLLPMSFVSIFLLAACFTVLLPQQALARNPAVSLPVFALALAPLSAFAYAHDIYAISYATTTYVAQTVARLPLQQPVLATLPEYNLFSTYDSQHRYLYMLNWPYDLAPERSRYDLTGQHLMQNWQRAGLDPGHILSCTEIFGAHPDLTVLVDFFRAPWFQDRLAHNSGYRIEDLGTATGWGVPFEIYSVHKLTPAATPCETGTHNAAPSSS